MDKSRAELITKTAFRRIHDAIVKSNYRTASIFAETVLREDLILPDDILFKPPDALGKIDDFLVSVVTYSPHPDYADAIRRLAQIDKDHEGSILKKCEESRQWLEKMKTFAKFWTSPVEERYAQQINEYTEKSKGELWTYSPPDLRMVVTEFCELIHFSIYIGYRPDALIKRATYGTKKIGEHIFVGILRMVGFIIISLRKGLQTILRALQVNSSIRASPFKNSKKDQALQVTKMVEALGSYFFNDRKVPASYPTSPESNVSITTFDILPYYMRNVEVEPVPAPNEPPNEAVEQAFAALSINAAVSKSGHSSSPRASPSKSTPEQAKIFGASMHDALERVLNSYDPAVQGSLSDVPDDVDELEYYARKALGIMEMRGYQFSNHEFEMEIKPKADGRAIRAKSDIIAINQWLESTVVECKFTLDYEPSEFHKSEAFQAMMYAIIQYKLASTQELLSSRTPFRIPKELILLKLSYKKSKVALIKFPYNREFMVECISRLPQYMQEYFPDGFLDAPELEQDTTTACTREASNMNPMDFISIQAGLLQQISSSLEDNRVRACALYIIEPSMRVEDVQLPILEKQIIALRVILSKALKTIQGTWCNKIYRIAGQGGPVEDPTMESLFKFLRLSLGKTSILTTTTNERDIDCTHCSQYQGNPVICIPKLWIQDGRDQ